MPIFSFHCTHCQADCELLVSASTAATCPHCGSGSLEKLVSRVAPPGRSARIMAAARSQAHREGHLSNFQETGKKRR